MVVKCKGRSFVGFLKFFVFFPRSCFLPPFGTIGFRVCIRVAGARVSTVERTRIARLGGEVRITPSYFILR